MTKQTVGKAVRAAIRGQHSWMAEGNHFDQVRGLLEKSGFALIESDTYALNMGIRDAVYVHPDRHEEAAHVTVAEFMGEFTDLQFKPHP
jgi:hypothetical protein